MSKWQIQDAKNKLSEVVRKARNEGPQIITCGVTTPGGGCRGPVRAPYPQTQRHLVDFLRKSPLGTVALDLTRSCDTGRAVVL